MVLLKALRGKRKYVGDIYLDPDFTPDYMRPQSVLLDGFRPTRARFSIEAGEWVEARRILYKSVPKSFGVHVISEPTEEEAERELAKSTSSGKIEVLAAGHDLARRINSRKIDLEQRATRLNSPLSFKLEELREFIVKSDVTIGQYRELVRLPIICGVLQPLRFSNTEAVLDRVTISCELEKLFDTGLNLVLLGEAGSGKTTTLQYYAQRKISEGSRRVVFVPLASLLPQLKQVPSDSALSGEVETLLHAITSYLKDLGVETLTSRFWSGDALLILDGIDEIATEAAWAVDAIAALADKYPKLQIITSSRFSGDFATKIPFIGISLRPFRRAHIAQFVKAWFGTSQQQHAEKILRFLESNSAVSTLAQSPLVLTILCTLEQHGVPLPQSECRLLDERIRLLLGDYDIAKQVIRLRTPGFILQKVAQRLAYALHVRGLRQGRLEELLAFASQGARSVEEAELAVRELIHPCNLLVPASARDEYCFGHLRFQEHLAALELVTNRGLALGDHNRSWWAGVFNLARQMLPHDEFTRLADSIPYLGSEQSRQQDAWRADSKESRLDSSELDVINCRLREVWGEDSAAETFLHALLALGRDCRKDEVSLGELRSATINLNSALVDQLAFWFSVGELALLEVRFRLKKECAPDIVLRPEQLSEAFETGRLFDPVNSEFVERFPQKVFPYFRILKRLRRLSGVDTESEVDIE